MLHYITMQRGQVMLLAILLIGGSVIGLSSTASFMMLHRLRMASDIADSTRAVFAAESGIECASYLDLKLAAPTTAINTTCSSITFEDPLNPGDIDPKTSVTVTAEIFTINIDQYLRIKSKGKTNRVNRALEVVYPK